MKSRGHYVPALRRQRQKGLQEVHGEPGLEVSSQVRLYRETTSKKKRLGAGEMAQR